MRKSWKQVPKASLILWRTPRKMLTIPFLPATFCCRLAHVSSDFCFLCMSLCFYVGNLSDNFQRKKKKESATVHLVFSFLSLETCLQNLNIWQNYSEKIENNENLIYINQENEVWFWENWVLWSGSLQLRWGLGF